MQVIVFGIGKGFRLYKEQRYTDYARANASIGINGTVLNNVNAQAKSLRTDWLVKASGLADVFRLMA